MRAEKKKKHEVGLTIGRESKYAIGVHRNASTALLGGDARKIS